MLIGENVGKSNGILRHGLVTGQLHRVYNLVAFKDWAEADSAVDKPIEPGTPPDVETQKRGAQLLREALAKAKAGEA